VSLGGGAQTPRGKKGTLVLRVVGAAGHKARMLTTYDFKPALTRVIELTTFRRKIPKSRPRRRITGPGGSCKGGHICLDGGVSR
jgi:hypothetical protein